MISISVRVASNRFPGMSARLKAGLRGAVQDAVQAVEAQATARVPVDTGELRDSIDGSMTGDTSGEVVATAPHAGFVEFGTTRMGAQPYMHPAADAATPGFVAGVRAVLGGL